MPLLGRIGRNLGRTVVIGTVGLISAGLLAAGPSLAASSGTGASGWHLGYYNSSGRALSLAEAAPLSGGLATFRFTSLPNSALLIATKGSDTGGLLGDLTGDTVTATVGVTGLNPGASFTYSGEPSCSGTDSYVRLFFETTKAGGFDETQYWWSNPVSVDLSTLSGTATVTASLADPSQWSDFYGHFGNDPAYAAGYSAATANVTGIGLSFGGGCFFENGVGTSDGSGSFDLISYTAG